MKTYSLNWSVGYTASPDIYPEEMFPAKVPGSVQTDYAAYKNWEPYYKDANFYDYARFEDVYWLYTAPLTFTLLPGQKATLRFSGIDYKYQIRVDNDILCEGEGMFAPVSVDVTAYAGKNATLEVCIFPAPKADDSNTRTQVIKSCKAAACYGWDWHPRLISAGLWDEVQLCIQDTPAIKEMDVSYALSDTCDTCEIKIQTTLTNTCTVKITLSEKDTIFAKQACSAEESVHDKGAIVLEKIFTANDLLTTGIEQANSASEYIGTYSLTLPSPKLWQPVGYGNQNLYVLSFSTLNRESDITDEYQRTIGFRRTKLVMNTGSWERETEFPKTRSDAPATLEINGRRIFAKGSNWVNAQVFPGDMNEAHYRELLTLVKDANMNILRIWGGGFINKESFYDLCDEMGIMVWQEFPLACNEYPNDEAYLAVLAKEATAIVKRLRTHPCLVLWCGGNELFNNWSKMTDQHHALRLLNSICYTEDRHTPFIMTSPLNGMGHGHYMNYDEETGKEFITLLSKATNTAYTEFGCPGAASPDYIKSFINETDYADCNPDNKIWCAHHGFFAWRKNCWIRTPEVEYFFGEYKDKEDLFEKSAFLQAMCYRSCFEEMRMQWPQCSMALNWCFNEPWPTVANNSLISWPNVIKPAYTAVREALRPTLAALRIDRHLWYAGETFRGEIWILNDSLLGLPSSEITVSYAIGSMPPIKWGTLYYETVPAQTNLQCGILTFSIPKDFKGELHIHLEVASCPEMQSSYTYLCRIPEVVNLEGMLNT